MAEIWTNRTFVGRDLPFFRRSLEKNIIAVFTKSLLNTSTSFSSYLKTRNLGKQFRIKISFALLKVLFNPSFPHFYSIRQEYCTLGLWNAPIWAKWYPWSSFPELTLTKLHVSRYLTACEYWFVVLGVIFRDLRLNKPTFSRQPIPYTSTSRVDCVARCSTLPRKRVFFPTQVVASKNHLRGHWTTGKTFKLHNWNYSLYNCRS